MTNSKTSEDWLLAVDLLIARAALDPKLAKELLNDSKGCCASNGVDVPEDVQLVIASDSQDVVIKKIPTFCQSDVKINIDELPQMVGSSTFNHEHHSSSSSEETSTETTQTTAAETTAVEAAEAATTVVVEAEAVIILT